MYKARSDGKEMTSLHCLQVAAVLDSSRVKRLLSIRLGILLCFLVTTQLLFGAASKTIHEVDNSGQNNRPQNYMQVFVDGEITTGRYPQPLISGQSITSWQVDQCNRYASGSPKFCIISFIQPTMAASTGYTVTYTSNANRCSSCTGSTPAGYLNATQMANFNPGGGVGAWDGQLIVAAPGSTTVTTSAKTMLAASDPASNSYNDCKNDYWLQGPVVTAVVVQECYQSAGTMHSQFDFGWTWNGSTMSSPVSGNSSTASFHPQFILYFYPTINAVQVEPILEIPYTGRYQDQLADVTIKTKDATGTLNTVWAHVGARKLTDVVTTQGSATITSATASFTNADIGLPIFISGSSVYEWDVIASVTNSTTAVMGRLCCQSGSSGTGQTAYINLQSGGSRHRKTFWSGTAPGHVRIDHNWVYMISTKLFPNYDQQSMVRSVVNPEFNSQTGKNGATAWSSVTNGVPWLAGDKGEWGAWGGFSDWVPGYANDSQGAPMQREELEYLYTMNAATSPDSKGCGDANSYCAKTWNWLTGEAGAIDTTINNLSTGCHLSINGTNSYCKDSGGVGVFYNIGNVPIHFRESQVVATGQISSGNAYYCPNLADKDANPFSTTTCGTGQGDATGKPPSIYTHSDQLYADGSPPVAAVGTFSLVAAGWQVGACDHMLDFYYLPYMLTGDPALLEEEQMTASFCLMSTNPDNAVYTRNGFYGFMNPNEFILRRYAFGLQTVGHAAIMSPDGSAEQNYYVSAMNSNLEIMEGLLGITGTSLTPSDTSCSSASVGSYDSTKANRWNWGRCTVFSGCAPGESWFASNPGTCPTVTNNLWFMEPGQCPANGGAGIGSEGPASDFVQMAAVVLTGGNGDAQAFVKTITGGVIQNDVVVAAGGTGYGSAPTCAILSNTFTNGTGATCTASVSGGAVTGVTITAGGTGYRNGASSMGVGWMQNSVTYVASILRSAGFTQAAGVSTAGIKQPLEMTLDSTSNPYLLALGLRTARSPLSGAGVPTKCSTHFSQSQDVTPSSWAIYAASHTANQSSAAVNFSGVVCSGGVATFTTSVQNWPSQAYQIAVAGGTAFDRDANTPTFVRSVPSTTSVTVTYSPSCPAASAGAGTIQIIPVKTFAFDQRTGSIPDVDHGYDLIARTALSFGQQFNVSTSNANCPGGTCTASDAWTWANTYIPYFNNSPPTTPGYTAPQDLQIKFALAPLSGVTVTSYTLSGVKLSGAKVQ